MESVVVYNSNKQFMLAGKFVFYRLGLFFFLLMLIIPTTFQMERGVLLVLLFTGSLVYALHDNWRMHQVVLLWGGVTIFFSLFFMTIGVLNNAPGALRVGTVYVIWPMLFLFFAGILHLPKQLTPFLNVIIIGSFGSALMALALVLDSLFGLNLGFEATLAKLGANVGIYDGVIEYRLFNMTTIIYALPLLLGILFTPRAYIPLNRRWRLFSVFTLALCILALLISGRRAFWVVAAFSPFVVWGLLLAGLRANVLKYAFIAITLGLVTTVIVVPFLGLDLVLIWEDILKGFDFSDSTNISSSRRVEQFIALTSGWMDSPLFGAGLGAAAADNLNLEKQAWAYELSYVALLFQTGLLGMLIYCSAVMWIFMKGIRVIRKIPSSAGLLIPTLSGLACFLVANATNPYLLKFDYLWTLFLPIAILNAYMLRGKS